MKEDLARAAYAGDTLSIRALMARFQGSPDSVRDSRGRTVLHVAAMGGRAETIACALGMGCSPSARDREGLTPLHLAAKEAKMGVMAVRELSRVSSTMWTDDEGRLPLHWALMNRRAECLPLLGGREEWAWRTLDGDTALTMAARMGSLEMASMAPYCAEVDASLEDGSTALHLAATHDHEGSLVRMLLGRGACVSAADSEGLFPVARALVGWNPKTFGILAERTDGSEALRSAGGAGALWERLEKAPDPVRVAFWAWVAKVEGECLGSVEGGGLPGVSGSL